MLYQLDWESVSDTVEEAMAHALDWHDKGNCSIVRVTASVELIASVVDCQEPEETETGERLLFS